MTSPIVLITRDARGRKTVRWYVDLVEWAAGRHIALVSSRELWVDGETDHDIRRVANRLSENEFESSSRPDVEWIATHWQPGQGEVPVPIEGRAA